uniref:Nucleoporin NUP42 n=1 Tax=Anopheles farauti TaxID=69004 RepID=A0A2C9GW55_9DIPT
MVICTYFLNNSCRFGSRCNNEHIDIGSIVKNEVDVTLKGNQWPLSCFGPFKERNCIPNFIDDQSFEEIRMMYLEAKMQNNIPSHQMQLAQMINDAKNKMQCLTTMNRDILNTLVELYNQLESSTKVSNAPPNPFSSIGTGGSNASASSIFGGATGASAFGSGFGSNATGSSGVASSIFGGGQSISQPTGSIFGSVAPTTNNIFAKPAQQATTGNIFGMAQTSQQPSNNVFGGPAVMGGGLFGNVQQPSQSTGTLFGGIATAAANPPSGGNIFASATGNGFGQQQQPANSTGFGGGGGSFFGNSTVPTTGGFGAAAIQPPQQQSSGLFNTVPFGSTNQPSTPFGQFGSSMQATNNPPSQNLFLPAPTVAAPFGSAMGAGGFGMQPVQPVLQTFAVPHSATMYSATENITAEHLAAFNADQFQLGRIPTVPPPKELCH